MKVMITKVPDMKPIKTGTKLFGNGGPAGKSTEREELEKNKAYNEKVGQELVIKLSNMSSSKRNMSNPEYVSLYAASQEHDKITNYLNNYDLVLINEDAKALQDKIKTFHNKGDYETSSKLTTELNQLLKTRKERQSFVEEHGVVKIDRTPTTNTPVNKPTEKYQNSPFTTAPVKNPPIVEQPKKTTSKQYVPFTLNPAPTYNSELEKTISEIKQLPIKQKTPTQPTVPQTGSVTNSNTPVPITPKTPTYNSSTPQGAMSQNEWYERAVKKGYSGENNPGSIQDWMVAEHPDDVVNYMTGPQGGMTNYGKKLFGNKDIKSYTREELLKGFRDGIYERRGPLPGDPTNVNTEVDKTASPTREELVPISDGYNNDPYKEKVVTPAKKPTFVGDKFDYSQYLPEAMDLFDKSVKPWTKKYSPELLKAPTENIQAQLNANQADMYYGMQNLGTNPASRNANIANLMAQKYVANQGIYEKKYNTDLQARTNVDNTNSQLINQAEQVNYGRAKTQVDEQSQLLDNEQTKKHGLFASLVNKKATYDADQQTKKFWFDIYSKNYTRDTSGNLVYADGSTPQLTSPSEGPETSVYAPKGETTKTVTTKNPSTGTTTKTVTK